MLSNDNLFDVLDARGLIAQATDESPRDRLAKPVTVYCGFDPTADSLHVGSLVPIMGLAHAQQCGHKPVALVGGATGMVGDPSGKTELRQMLTREQIDHNAAGIAAQIAKVVRFDESETGATLVNNADWLSELNWIEMLREVGSCLSVNRMLSMDSVRTRMDAAEGGITFLEFNYMVMQAYDFLHLYRERGVTLQLGGQDQWGNIVMGLELGRRLAGANLGGVTFPLVTKADGGKFGKSEGGNIWLDAARTPPYDFYQFWRNTADADVGKFLRMFTFLPVDRIAELESAEGAAINESKVVLAHEVTKLIHGEAEADRARDSASKAFAGGGLGSGGSDVTGESIPHETIFGDEFSGEGVELIELMKRAGLAASNSEARKLIQGGGVRVHNEKASDIKRSVTEADVVDGYVLIRRGKKQMFRFDLA